jgi:predicted Zn-dependent protease
VEARHSVQGMQRGTLLGLGVAVISGATGQTAYGPLAEQAGQLAAGLLDKSYSREQERESDRLGIDTMVKAGYNPLGAVQLQDFFYRQMEGGAEPMWLTGLFRTHPFSKERLQDAQAYIQSRYPAQAASAQGLKAEPFLQATAKLKSSRAAYAAYDQARALEAKGEIAQAVSGYLRAAQLAPGEALILTGLGTAYLKAGDLQAARMHLTRAVQLDGDYFQSRMGLGYAHLEQGAPQQAVPELEASMKLLPTVQGAYLLAEGYEQTGRRPQALELYRAVAQADPSGKLGQAAAARVKALGG